MAQTVFIAPPSGGGQTIIRKFHEDQSNTPETGDTATSPQIDLYIVNIVGQTTKLCIDAVRPRLASPRQVPYMSAKDPGTSGHSERRRLGVPLLIIIIPSYGQ